MGSYHAPKNTPRTGCIFAHATNPQPKPFQPTSSPPMQRNTPQCGVTKQCVAKECGAKIWRHRKMWRHQTMWRQTMWRQNVASQENVASPSNVAPNNAAPKCGATGKCGVTKQCGAKQCSAKMWRHRKMWRRQTMWRQTMWRHMSSKCVFIMCLQRQVEKCVLFCQHRDYVYIYKPWKSWDIYDSMIMIWGFFSTVVLPLNPLQESCTFRCGSLCPSHITISLNSVFA